MGCKPVCVSVFVRSSLILAWIFCSLFWSGQNLDFCHSKSGGILHSFAFRVFRNRSWTAWLVLVRRSWNTSLSRMTLSSPRPRSWHPSRQPNSRTWWTQSEPPLWQPLLMLDQRCRYVFHADFVVFLFYTSCSLHCCHHFMLCWAGLLNKPSL